MPNPLLTIEGLKKYWDHGSQLALDIPQLRVQNSEKIAILGPSGSGKSTFLKILSKDLKMGDGTIYFLNQSLDECSVRELSHQRAVLPQSHEVGFDLSVDLIVSLGRVSRPCQNETSYIVRQCLCLCQASHLLHRNYHQLSGGERARVQMAKVFAQLWDVHGGFLLVDEPFAALDPYLQVFLLKSLIQFVTQRSLAVLAVLHDVNHAMQFFDRGLLLKQGQLFMDAPLLEIQKESLEHLYGNHFLQLNATTGTRYFFAQ